MIPPEVQTVLTWHEALNGGDRERVVALSDPEVEVGGPRGSGRGSALLREWVERANIRLQPERIFRNAEGVVVEQRAEWCDAETGEITGAQTVASVFVVRDGKVASVLRYDTLPDALDAAGLDGAHELRPS